MEQNRELIPFQLSWIGGLRRVIFCTAGACSVGVCHRAQRNQAQINILFRDGLTPTMQNPTHGRYPLPHNRYIEIADMVKKKNPTPILQGASILSFSLERWGHVWRSRHHIMSALARDNKVLFASSPYYIRDVMRNPVGLDEDATGVSRVADNLHAYIPPRWLPTIFRYPKLDRLIKDLRAWHLRKAMRRLGMARPILYIWHPSFADLVGDFDESLVVYHCYDEYSSFDATKYERELRETQERALLKRADIVFTVSDKVRARRLEFNPNIYTINNGVDYQLFSKAQYPETVVPEDIRVIPRPVIGLVTTLTSITDIPLLTQIFQRRSDWSFVFIGLENPPEHMMSEELKAFQRLPNVYVIGRRTLQDIPGYLKGCDVCAIPWVINELSLSGSPLKLYEYLASGKPVVSTPLSHLLPLEKVISFASNADEWIDAIEGIFLGESQGMIENRQSVARENTWEKKVEFISQKLEQELTKRQDL